MSSWTPQDDNFSLEFQSIRSKIEDLELKFDNGTKERKKQQISKEEKPSSQQIGVKDSEVFQQLVSSYKILSSKNEDLQRQNEILQREKESSITSTDAAIKLLQDSLEEEKIVNKTLRSKLLYIKRDTRIPRLEAESTIHKRMIIKLMKKLKKTQEKYVKAMEDIKEKDKIIESLRDENKEKKTLNENKEHNSEIDSSDSDNDAEIDSLSELHEQIEALTKENNELRQHNLEIMNGKLQKAIEEENSGDSNQSLEEENKLLRKRLVELEKSESVNKNLNQNAVKDLESVINVCKQLSKKVDDLENENNKFMSIREQLEDAIKSKDELAAKLEELQSRTLEEEVPKQIDVTPIFEQMEVLQKENDELKKKVNENNNNEVEELSKKVAELTRQNHELSIKVISLSDKTEDPEDGLVVVEDIDEQVADQEKEDDFSDDFVDDEEDIEESIKNDAEYWRSKYESMKERVKILEEKLELSFNTDKDCESLLSKHDNHDIPVNAGNAGFTQFNGEDSDGDNGFEITSDFEDDDFGEEEDLLQESKSQFVEKPDFNETEHFEKLKETMKDSQKEGEEILTDEIKFEDLEESDEKIKKLEKENEELKAKVEEFEKKKVEQEQMEQYLIKRCNDAQMFIDQQEFEMETLRDKKKLYKKKLKELEASVPDNDTIKENSTLAKEIQTVQQQIADALKEQPN